MKLIPIEILNSLFKKIDKNSEITNLTLYSKFLNNKLIQTSELTGKYHKNNNNYIPFIFETKSIDTKDIKKEAIELIKFLNNIEINQNNIIVNNNNKKFEFEFNKKFDDKEYDEEWEIKSVGNYINELYKEIDSDNEKTIMEITNKLENFDKNMIIIENKDSYEYILMGDPLFKKLLEEFVSNQELTLEKKEKTEYQTGY